MSKLFAGAAGKLAGVAIGIGGVGALLQQSIYNVEAGHRAVIFDRISGVLDKVSPEGMHFCIPFLQRPIIYDVRTRPRSISTTTGTKDLQVVSISLRVLSKPSVNALPNVYRRLGLDYDERVLPSIGNEVLKATVAQFNADQLLTMRDQVSKDISEALTHRAKEFNILLDDVSIVHVNFSREFAAAIEHKQVAQQEAERSKFVVMVAEQEKKAAIIQAEGESEAAKLISDALGESGDAVIEIRRIEASRHVAKTLASSRNVTYLPSGGANGGGPNMLLNMKQSV